MDIVYILGKGSEWGDNEIRYSLRSVEKFISGYNDVYIVGHCPEWLRNIIHLPQEDSSDQKEFNIATKIMTACNHTRLSDKFICMADDYIMLEKVNIIDIIPYHIGHASAAYDIKHGRTKEKIANLISVYPEAFYYDIHQPFPYYKKLFIDVMGKLDWEIRTYPVKSIYMAVSNMKKDSANVISDFKIKYPLVYPDIIQDIDTRMYIEHNYSFAYGPKSLNDDMKKYLQQLLPNKSKFEA